MSAALCELAIMMVFLVQEDRVPYTAQETPVGVFSWTFGSKSWMFLNKALLWMRPRSAPLQELNSAVLIRSGLHFANKGAFLSEKTFFLSMLFAIFYILHEMIFFYEVHE